MENLSWTFCNLWIIAFKTRKIFNSYYLVKTNVANVHPLLEFGIRYCGLPLHRGVICSEHSSLSIATVLCF